MKEKLYIAVTSLKMVDTREYIVLNDFFLSH